jgi:mannose-binding lectin 1
VLRDLGRKMDEIVGRQERELSMLTSISTRGPGDVAGGAPPPPQQQQPPPGVGGSQADINYLVNSHRELLQTARDIKSLASDIQTRTNTISQQQAAAGGGGSAQQIGSEFHGTINTIKDTLDRVKRDVSLTSDKLNSGISCPTAPCISNVMFISIALVQLLIILGYLMYRDSKEQKPKFY